MSQLPWEWLDAEKKHVEVDGVTYKKGYGEPGGANNCLIDSLRQCMIAEVKHNLDSDVRKVRSDLMGYFPGDVCQRM